MSSTLTLKIATLTSAVTFAKTDAEVAQILRWFVQDRMSPIPDGLTQQQQNQLALDAATAEIVRYVRQEATRVHLRELRAGQASLETQADTDAAL